MSLQGIIDEKLWSAVQSSYIGANYKAAILEAIHVLNELIREKSGLTLDGTKLVTKALGGDSPVIRLNNLRTISDTDEQQGILNILIGLNHGIRNPRSHGPRNDERSDAEAIIGFIDFLYRILEKAKSPYDTASFIPVVLDPHFAKNQRYAEKLAERVPATKRLELLISLFEGRDSQSLDSITLFQAALLPMLSSIETSRYWERISEILMECQADEEYRTAVLLIDQNWNSCSELSRMRVEHHLIESIGNGRFDVRSSQCSSGHLGTYAGRIAMQFTLQKELISSLVRKIACFAEHSRRAYVWQYFDRVLLDLIPDPPSQLIETIKKCLEKSDEPTYHALLFLSYDQNNPYPAWSAALKDAIEKCPLYDDVPF